MSMENKKISLVFLYFFLDSCYAAEKVLIEPYEPWQHRVLRFLKSTNSLYLKSVSLKMEACSTFYVRFKTKPGVSQAQVFSVDGKIYEKLFKANSSFPYEVQHVTVNAGWCSPQQWQMVYKQGDLSLPSLWPGWN